MECISQCAWHFLFVYIASQCIHALSHPYISLRNLFGDSFLDKFPPNLSHGVAHTHAVDVSSSHVCIDEWRPTASTLCLFSLPRKKTHAISPSYAQSKDQNRLSPENFMAIGGSFKCYTYRVRVLRWSKKKERKKVNNSDFRPYQVCHFKIVTTRC